MVGKESSVLIAQAMHIVIIAIVAGLETAVVSVYQSDPNSIIRMHVQKATVMRVCLRSRELN